MPKRHHYRLQTEHVSVAGAGRKTERSGPKIRWSGTERGADVAENDGAGAEREVA